MDAKELLAEQLLKIKAIKLQPNDPFTWASGWKSPFYCDNRKTLSYPFIRTLVKNAMVSDILNNFTEAEAIVGVATGGVPQGALVADELNLPFGYVRSKPKDHGMGNMIEGDVKKGAKVVVCEDLVSTGGSSLKAVEALREAGYDVIGMVASYTYQFDVAKEAFNNAGVKLVTVTDYEHVVKQALASGYIKESDVETLHAWRSNPSEWDK
jgi:orotate phosphoribosyltransferase